MDLILWRHAEAVDKAADGGDDLARELTARGEKDAKRMGAWLDRRLPEGARIVSSPARRCEQTAQALGRKFKIRPEIAPGATPEQLLEAAQWPNSRQTVVLVNHQPVLGETIARLMGLHQDAWPVRKGGVWWFRSREREGELQTLVVAVQPPDLA
ncbi:MAG TPA: histidine phosphatase family protein [Ramlibacter sp.]|nr:histidine phosphatase family protein [Ramlibacter sp.]